MTRRTGVERTRDWAVVGTFAVPAEHPSLPGHFPGDKLVPGVVLLDHALALAAGGRAVVALAAKFLGAVRGDELIEVAVGLEPDGRFGFVGRRGGEAVLLGQGRLS